MKPSRASRNRGLAVISDSAMVASTLTTTTPPTPSSRRRLISWTTTPAAGTIAPAPSATRLDRPAVRSP
jgi:hypothetical protein